MNDVLLKILEHSPEIGAILAVVWLLTKWHERISMAWLERIDKIDQRHENMSQRWVDSLKEIGEKCHEAHERVATMYYEQTARMQETAAKLSVHIEHLAAAVKDRKP